MLAYIGRRLLATLPVMAVVAVFVFSMLRLTPGDPASIIAGAAATSQDIVLIRQKLGLDRPIVTQFFIWLGHVLSGDFGESFFYKKQVAELIADRVGPTLALATLTMALSILISVPLGVVAAYRQGTWLDRIVMGFSVLGFSVPVFVVGYVLIYVFSIKLNWLPVQGYQPLAEGFGGFVQRLILPSLALSVIYIALIARITRTSVLEVLGEDYIRTARAKGLTNRVVLMRHALRNAAVPIVTVIGLGIALLIGGVVVTESVFS
nr:ABC transporter permease [Pseudomonadota bacterium]